MSTAFGVSKEHITKTPGVCGGKACIAGSRIRVMDIVGWHEHQKQTPDEILQSFPQLTHAAIHAALVYYFDNREEIADLFEESRRMDEFGKAQPSLLRDALAKRAAAVSGTCKDQVHSELK